jgi:hypothetical protein
MIHEAMVAKKPGTPGRARSSRKTIAQGRPVFSAHLFVLVCVSLRNFAHKACGCELMHPVFPAPSDFRGVRTLQNSGRARRENKEARQEL